MSKNEYQPLVIHKDSPFKQRIERRIQITTDSDSGNILNEKVTITRERQYIPMPWVKLFQDKELLRDLSPWGWYVLGHISLNITWNQEKMKISRQGLGMTKPMFRRTMLELLGKQIIASTGIREWYWVNIGLVIMGTVNKHDNNGKT